MIDSILPVLGLCPTVRIVYVAPLPRAHLTRLHPAFSPFGLPVYLIASPAFDSCGLALSGRRPADGAALSAGSELVVVVFEQDVERGERSVTAGNILLQVELVRIAQFVACVHLLLENSQIIPNHDDFVEECLERDFFRLKRTVRRLHDQRPALPPSRQTFYEHILLFQPERFDYGVSSIADQIRKRPL